MEHYAGIDVSLEQSSLCVVDATGKIVREAKVASEPVRPSGRRAMRTPATCSKRCCRTCRIRRVGGSATAAYSMGTMRLTPGM
jgi:hypothetical protein